MNKIILDETDRRLLRRLMAQPESPMPALAQASGVAAPTATRRLARLSEAGVLRGRHAVIDWEKAGFAVQVSLRVTLDKTQSNAFDEIISQARRIPEVIEIQTFLGRVDLRLGVVARDMAHYQKIYRGQILALPHIADIEALMHVASLKTDRDLPL